jgi:hypothetical protein
MTDRGAPTLRPYQEAATAAVLEARRAGQNRLLVQKPTGTGKTVWFASLLDHLTELDLHKGRGAAMLVIAHREELLDQAADKITRAHPGVMVAIEQGDRHASRYSDVVIASIQTLAAMKFRRLQRLLQHHEFRLVIVDEAHHAAAKTYRTMLAHLGFLPFAEAAIGQDNIEAATHDDVGEMEKALAGWDAIARQGPTAHRRNGDAEPLRRDRPGLRVPDDRVQLRAAEGDRRRVARADHALGHRDDDVARPGADDGRRFQPEAARGGGEHAGAQHARGAAWREYAERCSTIAFTVDVAHAHDLATEFRARHPGRDDQRRDPEGGPPADSAALHRGHRRSHHQLHGAD